MRNEYTWSLYRDGLISRELLLASLGKSQDLTLHTKIDKMWYNGALCDILLFGYGTNLYESFERIDFYPDFTQIWSEVGGNDVCVAVLPRWMVSEL